jgi:transcription antitermination factor NusG
MEKWYILHTKHRWEKKLTDVLVQKGIECYCPVKMLKRKWSDRIKLIEEPLFKCYVFVKIVPEQKTAVRLTEGVINFVYNNGKPALIKEKEIKGLKKLLLTNNNLSLSGNKSLSDEPNQYKEIECSQVYMDRLSKWLLAHIEQPTLV